MTDAELIAAVRTASARVAAAKKAHAEAHVDLDRASTAMEDAMSAYLEAREECERVFTALGQALAQGAAA